METERFIIKAILIIANIWFAVKTIKGFSYLLVGRPTAHAVLFLTFCGVLVAMTNLGFVAILRALTSLHDEESRILTNARNGAPLLVTQDALAANTRTFYYAVFKTVLFAITRTAILATILRIMVIVHDMAT